MTKRLLLPLALVLLTCATTRAQVSRPPDIPHGAGQPSTCKQGTVYVDDATGHHWGNKQGNCFDATAPAQSSGGYTLRAADYSVSTTSSTAVSAVGVRDPVDRELSFALGTGGSLAQGGIFILFTYTNASGETIASNWRAVGTYTNCTVVITSPPAVTNATGWNIYATTIASAYTTAKKQNASPLTIGSNYTYSSYNSGGSALPASNTTGGSQTVTVADGSLLFAPADAYASWPSKIYQSLVVDVGTSQEEAVYVMAKPNSTTITTVFTKTHSTGFTVKSATGGIQEAIMSLPNWPANSSQPGKGGTVIIPSYTIIKAPIHLRRGTRLDSDGPPAALGDLGGNRLMSAISFSSTDPGIGALMMFGTSNEFELHNIAVWSATNALYAQGAMGSVGSAKIDGCLLYGNTGNTVHNTSGLRASAGTFYTRVTNSVILGSPAVWIYGQFLNSTTLEHLVIVPQKDNADASFIARGIVVEANGGSPNGFAGGGFIRIRDVTTENGNGPLLDLTDVNFDVEQFDVADWMPAVSSPSAQIKIKQTAGYAISTMRLSRVIMVGVNDAAWDNQAGVEISKVTTFEPLITIGVVTMEDCQFPGRGIAIDAGGVRGPFRLLRNRNLDVTGTGAGGIANAPTNGLLAFGNFPQGSNAPDGILTDTGPNGVRATSVAGLSGTVTPAKNLRGSVTISNTSTEGAVSFSTAEADASYYVQLTAEPSTSATVGQPYVKPGTKAAGGFTVKLTAAPGSGNSVVINWVLVR